MKPPVFYGQHEVTLDGKNRMLVPADVRSRLNQETQGNGFFLVVGTNGRPWLFPSLYYEFLATQDKPELTPGKDISDFDRFNFALAHLVELDGQGRVLLPAKTFEWTGIQSKSLMLLGARDHLELWDRGNWRLNAKPCSRTTRKSPNAPNSPTDAIGRIFVTSRQWCLE